MARACGHEIRGAHGRTCLCIKSGNIVDPIKGTYKTRACSKRQSRLSGGLWAMEWNGSILGRFLYSHIGWRPWKSPNPTPHRLTAPTRLLPSACIDAPTTGVEHLSRAGRHVKLSSAKATQVSCPPDPFISCHTFSRCFITHQSRKFRCNRGMLINISPHFQASI